MPMYLLLVVCALALFAAVAFYLFHAPGKSTLLKPAPSNTMLVAPTLFVMGTTAPA